MNIVWFIWGLPQNIIGLFLYLCCAKVSHVKEVNGRFVCFVPDKNIGAVSLGIFILFFADFGDRFKEVLSHEYGHTIQSKILGPLYLLIIGLPSIIWAGCFCWYRKKYHVNYYSFYPEKWATYLGEKYYKEEEEL